MHKETYFSKFPQSVLVCGSDFKVLTMFVEQWSTRLLAVSEAEVSKCPDFHAVWPIGKMRQISVEKGISAKRFNKTVLFQKEFLRNIRRNGRTESC